MTLTRPNWKALTAALAVSALVAVTLLPMYTVYRPGKAFTLTEDGKVLLLTVEQGDVSLLSRLYCERANECVSPDVTPPSPPLTPLDAQGAVLASTQAAAQLAGVDMPERLPTVTGVSGNSGGVSFALAQYLDFTSSHAGLLTAASGSLTPAGVVGPVAGLGAKAMLAEQRGVKILIVPSTAPDLSRWFTGQIVKVDTLEQAVDALCSEPGSTCPAASSAS